MAANLKLLQQQVDELTLKWQRAVADYHNLERRVNEQQMEFVRFANAGLISQLLSIIDDLERANGHMKDEGLKLVISRFREVLKNEGVEEIEAEGKDFDPILMEGTDQVAGKKNVVVKVVNKGYKLNGRVLRPAKVAVGKGEAHE